MRALVNFFLSLLCLSVCASEKIIAIMVTGKCPERRALAELAARSFLEQTYPNKELLIINDGQESWGKIVSPEIREVRVAEKCTLGRLRNIGLECLEEDAVWVQWDDDDFHHPLAMQEQYRILAETRASACCMRSQIQYALKKNAAWEMHGLIPGTIMCRKKKEILYPEIARDEDMEFLKQYLRYGVIPWNNPAHYYIRLIHEYNTWEEDHFRLEERKCGEWELQSEEKKYLESLLPHYLEPTLFSWVPTKVALNFGDALSPLIVEKMLGRAPPHQSKKQLLAVGSILHYAHDGDIIWGEREKWKNFQ